MLKGLSELEYLVRRLRRLTALNDHTGAAVALAEALGEEDRINDMRVIDAEARRLMHMPPELLSKRYVAVKEMWAEAKVAWGQEIGQRVYMAM